MLTTIEKYKRNIIIYTVTTQETTPRDSVLDRRQHRNKTWSGTYPPQIQFRG